jgi:DNA primase
MSRWIDFRKLRQDVDLQALLQHYQVKLRFNGSQGQGFCPLPTHRGRKRSPSFSVNFDRKIWQCFGCKARGNAIDFALRMEGHKPSDTQAVRQVAEMLVQNFVPHGKGRSERQPPAERDVASQANVARRDQSPPPGAKAVLVNPALDFKLRNLDPKHPYLKERHLKPATIAHFGLGLCSLGMLKDRIAIPLHDAAGKLIGYAGRVVDDTLISETNPKYRFPGKREYQGKIIEFHKSLFLYNGYRVRNATNIIVVEGFVSAWWLWQCGYPQVVALMGSSCSEQQLDLIVNASAPDGTVWIITDNDDAGVQCGGDLVELLDGMRKCEWLRISNGRQPTDYALKELRRLIPFAADKSGAVFKRRVATPSNVRNMKARNSTAASS